MLHDFQYDSKLSDSVIDKYKERVPAAMLVVWREQGLGRFLNGYLKTINPDDYLDFVVHTYFRGKGAIPLFVTAFGDIIVYTENDFIDIVYYRHNDFKIMTSKMTHFFMFINDKTFTDDYFEILLYEEAVQAKGQLNYEECFAFVPLLALGGKKDVAHMERAGIQDYLSILTQFQGGV